LSEAQKLSHTGSFGWDVSSGELYWSPETFRIFEYEPTTKVTVELGLQRTHPEDRSAVEQLFERVSRERTEFDFEHRLLMPDGSVKYLRIVGRPSGEESGCLGFVGAVTDITERKLAEKELRRSEESLLEAQRLSHTGSWRHDAASRTFIVSPEMYRIFGIKSGEDPSSPDFFVSRLHPEDRERVHELFEKSETQKTDYQVDQRIVLPDGAIKHLHVIGHPVLNESGDLVEFVGTVMDVTAAKLAEEKIRQSERELRQLIDLSPQHIAEFGPDGRPLYNNQAALDYHGLTLEEWQSADLNRLLYPQDAERATREGPGKFLSGSPYEMEVRLRRRDGQYRWFLFRFKPMLDEQGRLTRWYSWPGNVRELQNLIERSVILSTGVVLSGSLSELTHPIQNGSKWSKASTPVTLQQAESSHILQTLQQTKGVIAGRNGAAARLGLPRTTLIAKMRRLGINGGQSSALPVGAVALVPSSEDPIPRMPALSGISHEAARSGNSKLHPDVGRVCTLAEAEREYISVVVAMTNGLIEGKGGAAEALGLPSSTLRNRMKKLGIKP
jgi:PAS domain S-box-containing protein